VQLWAISEQVTVAGDAGTVNVLESVGGVFGSSCPRALQLGARVTF
jgi:hypothetical protein